MGQYYIAVNLDKKEFLHPHRCGDGMKLLELVSNSLGTLACLSILLAEGNGGGGGDIMGPKCRARKCKGRGWYHEGDGPGSLKPCAKCNGTGHKAPPAIIGSWAGDRIVVCGDYAEKGKHLTDDMKERYRLERALKAAAGQEVDDREINLFDYVCREGSEFKDVSAEALEALKSNHWVRGELEGRMAAE